MDGKTTEKENFASEIPTFVDRVSGLNIFWDLIDFFESLKIGRKGCIALCDGRPLVGLG